MRKGLPKSYWLVALLVFLAPACLREGTHGIGMKRVTSSLIYGVPPLSEIAAPPGAIPQIPESVEPEIEFSSSFRPRTTPAAVQQCPEAGPNDFPEEPAPNTVTAKPKEGLYAWKLNGTQRVEPFPFPFRLASFLDRSVEDVREDSLNPATNFTFVTKERDPSLNSNIVITQSFQVDQTNPSQELRGVLLTRLERSNPDGTGDEFVPNPPIQFLPLPVQIGQASSFDSTGIDARDPLRIKTLTHNGFVKERLRVDACGTVVDSWLIEAEQIIGAGASTTRKKYHYSIAPHFGGMIIFEHVESPCNAEVDGNCTDADLVYDTNIGQTEPDPPESQ